MSCFTHVWNDSVEATVRVSKAMLAGCELSEVSGCPWDFVIEQLENDSATRFLINCDVKLWNRAVVELLGEQIIAS